MGELPILKWVVGPVPPPAAGEVDLLLALRVHRPWCEMEPPHELVADENVHGGAGFATVRTRISERSLSRLRPEAQTEQTGRRERRVRLPAGQLARTFFEA